MLSTLSCDGCHFYTFSGETSTQVLCPLFNWVVCFFVVVKLWEFFTYSEYEPLTRYTICKYFSHSVGCLVALLVVPSDAQKLLSFLNPYLSIFSLL